PFVAFFLNLGGDVFRSSQSTGLAEEVEYRLRWRRALRDDQLSRAFVIGELFVGNERVIDIATMNDYRLRHDKTLIRLKLNCITSFQMCRKQKTPGHAVASP